MSTDILVLVHRPELAGDSPFDGMEVWAFFFNVEAAYASIESIQASQPDWRFLVLDLSADVEQSVAASHIVASR